MHGFQPALLSQLSAIFGRKKQARSIRNSLLMKRLVMKLPCMWGVIPRGVKLKDAVEIIFWKGANEKQIFWEAAGDVIVLTRGRARHAHLPLVDLDFS